MRFPQFRRNGLPFRVCLFFAIHPDKELTTAQVGERFDFHDYRAIRESLMFVVDGGMVEVKKRGKENAYKAGPNLRSLVKTIEEAL